MAFALVAAAAGILVDTLFPQSKTLWITAILGFLLFYFLALASRRSSNILLFFLLAPCFGLIHHLDRYHFPPDELALRLPEEGTPATLELWVSELPTLYLETNTLSGETRTEFTAKIARVKNRGQWESASGNARVYAAGDCSSLKIGDRLRICGHLGFPPQERNPGGLSRAERLRVGRILLTLNIDHPERIRVLAPKERFPIRRAIGEYRLSCQHAFEKYLRPQNAELACAMLLGIRSGLRDETYRRFRETGTAHLLAISGIHVGIIAGLLFFALRLFQLPRRAIAVITALVIIGYVFLTDARPPVVRAAVLIVILCGGTLLRRKPLSINSLCVAAVFILAIHPAQLFDPGAHLSFLATGVLILLPSFEKRLAASSWGKRMELRFRALDRVRPVRGFFLRAVYRGAVLLAGALYVSFAVWLILLPLVLNRMNLFSAAVVPLTPLLGIPTMLALGGGFILMLVSPFPPLAHLAAPITNFGFGLLSWILQRGEILPSRAMVGPPDWWCLLFYIPLIAWVLIPLARARRQALRPRLTVLWLAAMFLLGIGAMVFPLWRDRAEGRLRAVLLSVGHGQAVLVRFPDHRVLLLDCGTSGNPAFLARTVTRALFSLGCGSIDLAILTHADSDHINGICDLVGSVPTGRVAVHPKMFQREGASVKQIEQELRKRGIAITEIAAGQSPAGFPELTVLHPPRGAVDPEQTNANSIVLALRWAERGILFPGDIDSPNAEFLSADPEPFDIVVAPHHGGKSQNTEAILSWAAPKTILISGGNYRRNTKGEEKLKDQGYSVLNTADSDALIVDIVRKPLFGKTSEEEGTPVGKLTVTTQRRKARGR
ncbi:MAG: ComEC/Rec2 family competence protein [Thermoguttaceae bacterium]|nr:ComEC/Rec2 family competence protein [Thermoguttaceae bacterium]